MGGAYEMMPKAWYSLTALLLIRANRPCCIPRSKRKTATLLDGCRHKASARHSAAGGHSGRTSSISTGTRRVHIHGRAIQNVINMTYQKSCCFTRCLPLRFHDWVVVSQMSLARVNAPGNQSASGCRVKRTIEKPLTSEEEGGPSDESVMTLEDAGAAVRTTHVRGIRQRTCDECCVPRGRQHTR